MRTILALLCACLHVPVATAALGDEDFEGDRGARDGPQDALRGPLRPLARQAEGARADALHPREHDRGDAGGPLLPAVGRPPRRRGYLCLSVDLPCHSHQSRPVRGPEGIAGLAPCAATAGAKDVVANLVEPGLRQVLDHLINVDGGAGRGHVAKAVGTSRGRVLRPALRRGRPSGEVRRRVHPRDRPGAPCGSSGGPNRRR